MWESYASLDSAAAQAALDHTLPVPYPLNVRLYATLLLSTFGEDGASLPSPRSPLPTPLPPLLRPSLSFLSGFKAV